ncbi:MAG: hypothetical protein Q4G27_02840 [Flavobacteriaceae bacterium]|nr:hypothetical protein [Flavobacteriaceae bacterium]
MRTSTKPLIVALLLFVNCDINMKFKGEDKNWSNIYKTNDILIFTSKKSQDTIYISSVETKNTNVDVMTSSYNPICTNVNYTDSNNRIFNMFSICKEEPNIPTWAGFNFKNDKGRIKEINNYPVSTIIFRGKERKGYMFSPYKPMKPSFWWDLDYGLRNPNLEYFIWDKEYGIIEYKTMQGEVFVLNQFIREKENILK